ncbi:MAG: class III signal peptide-containing protein [Methanobrevibacter sp.]
MNQIICKINRLFKDDNGQGAAEYILLLGGVVIIAIIALLIYRSYISSSSNLTAESDTNSIRQTLNSSV